MDHREARIAHFDREDSQASHVVNDIKHRQTHVKAGSRDGKRTVTDHGYLEGVVASIADASEWLIIGPGSAKDEFAAYVRDLDKNKICLFE